MDSYQDSKIRCTDDGISIRSYYFPVGTKHIPYAAIRSIERFELTARRGKGRIWGSGGFRHWANLDVRRPTKSVGFTLGLSGHVVPVLTPDDPDRFESVVRERTGIVADS
jgi:hypothetical protein